MHQPIREGLEAYLSGERATPQLAEFNAHLSHCAECRASVEAMTQQSQLLQSMRPEQPFDPTPGFYARVLERIESQGSDSFWSIFLEPMFGKRFGYAAFAVFLILSGVALVGGQDSVSASSTPEAVLATHAMAYPPAPGLDQQHDRDVVFAKLASWSDGQQAEILVASE
jgi:anti-sigma factor RsiW